MLVNPKTIVVVIVVFGLGFVKRVAHDWRTHRSRPVPESEPRQR